MGGRPADLGRLVLCAALLTGALLTGAGRADIIWISQVQSDSGKEFPAYLRSRGYTVHERILTSATLDQAALAELNAAQLVIFSRKIASGNYNTAAWDESITAPMIVMSPFVTRSSIWGWFAGESLPAATPLQMQAEAGHTGDALFAGVAVDGSGMMPGWHTEVGRSTTFSGEAEAPGGMILARTDGGALAAARWTAGPVAAGPRLFLAMGCWEPAGTTIADAGAWNLPETGARIFVNAVGIYTGPVVPATFHITAFSRHPATGAVTLSWESAAGQTFTVQHSRDLAGWSPVAAGLTGAPGTTSYTDNNPPTTAGPVFYRVTRAP